MFSFKNVLKARISLYILHWSWTTNPSAVTSEIPGSQACDIMPSFYSFSYFLPQKE